MIKSIIINIYKIFIFSAYQKEMGFFVFGSDGANIVEAQTKGFSILPAKVRKQINAGLRK